VQDARNEEKPQLVTRQTMTQFYGMRRLNKPNDWDGLAGAWVPGKSAYELAYSWHGTGGIPLSVAQPLEESGHEVLRGLRLEVALVEKPVFLDTLKGPSMTDLMGYARNAAGNVIVIGVEGKAGEVFSTPVVDWLRGGGDKLDPKPRPSRVARLAYLATRLGISIGQESTLRYQLLHRTVSVLAESELYGAVAGLVVVHSFAHGDGTNWRDYQAFLTALGLRPPVAGKVTPPVTCHYVADTPLFFLWVDDVPRDARVSDESNRDA
jgi:hypothetical protein